MGKWFGVGDPVVYRDRAGTVKTSTVVEPRGDASWVTTDEEGESILVSNELLFRAP